MLESRPEDALVKLHCIDCGDCRDRGDCENCRDCGDCGDCGDYGDCGTVDLKQVTYLVCDNLKGRDAGASKKLIQKKTFDTGTCAVF